MRSRPGAWMWGGPAVPGVLGVAVLAPVEHLSFQPGDRSYCLVGHLIPNRLSGWRSQPLLSVLRERNPGAARGWAQTWVLLPHCAANALRGPAPPPMALSFPPFDPLSPLICP